MKTIASRSIPFLAPTGSGGSSPPPVTFVSGQERLVASFLGPEGILLTYFTPTFTRAMKRPVDVSALRAPTGGSRPIVDLLGLSGAMRAVARNAVLGAQPPPTTPGQVFHDGQRKILVDAFTGDSMDDDDFTTTPSTPD